jgi:transcriptional regulator with XRE-family HTH domain
MLRNKIDKIRLCLAHKRGKEIKQTVFARFLGVNYGLYNRWKNHKIEPSLESYYKCSQKIKCSINDLLEDIPE